MPGELTSGNAYFKEFDLHRFPVLITSAAHLLCYIANGNITKYK